MNIKLYGATHKGYVRNENEDFYLTKERPFPLFIVADGVGGERGGEIASKLASENIAKLLFEKQKRYSGSEYPSLIQEAFIETNHMIHNTGMQSRKTLGMCTTLTLGFIKKDTLFVGYAGDSEAFIFRSSKEIVLTKPHTLAYGMGITADDHPLSHVLTRVVGQKDPLEADVTSLVLEKGDKILLATDGLSKYVPLEEVKEVIYKSKPELITDNLIALALQYGGRDNITVVVCIYE